MGMWVPNSVRRHKISSLEGENEIPHTSFLPAAQGLGFLECGLVLVRRPVSSKFCNFCELCCLVTYVFAIAINMCKYCVSFQRVKGHLLFYLIDFIHVECCKCYCHRTNRLLQKTRDLPGDALVLCSYFTKNPLIINFFCLF